MNKTRYKWKRPNYETMYLSSSRESVLLFKKNTKQLQVFGIGKVMKVEQGKKFDNVYLDVGKGYSLNQCLKVIVLSQMARKQIYTLTLNQYTMFYGYKAVHQKGIFATCFFPSYVPKITDRNLILEENDGDLGFESISDENEINEDNEIQDILSQFERK